MSEKDILLSADAADKLLACADGNAALLYLHIRTGGKLSLSAAARDLRRSEAEIAAAAETLRKLGLLPKPEAPLAQSELPAPTAQDIVMRAQTDSTFRDLVSETEKSLGRVLSSHDLATLFGIYDHLGLPADVIMLLLHHCIDEVQAHSGPGRVPTMRYIEKEAWFWADQEIMNLDAAEAHLQRHRARQEAQTQIQDVMQIRGRSLTKGEREYVESWIAMGFGPDAVAVAYDRMMLNTGKLSWKYMDSILRSWDAKHLYTPEAIEAGDPARRGKRTAAAPADSRKQIEDLRKVYRNISGGKES